MTKKASVNFQELITLNWEEKTPCSYKVTVSVPAAAIDAATENTVRYISASAKVPGFREGQVPTALVRSRYKDAIKSEMTEAVLSTAAMKMRQDETRKVLAYGIPESEPINLECGKDGTVIFDVDVAPTFKVPEYKGLNVSVETDVVTEDKVADRLKQLREAFGEFKKVEDELKKDDIAQVKYSADVTLPEDAPASLKALVNAENTWLWIGDTDRLPGSSAAMTGKKVGDVVTFSATFPEDHAEPFLAGKTLTYEVTINDAQRRVPLTDNEALCQRFGVKTLDEVMTRLKADMEEEAKDVNMTKIMTAIREKLAAEVPAFPLPPSILQRKIFHHMREIMNETVKSEADSAAFTANREQHEADAKARAEKSLHAFFILAAIADLEKISVTEKELEERIAAIARYLKQGVEETKKVIQERQAEQDIVNDLLEQKVLEFAAQSAKIN